MNRKQAQLEAIAYHEAGHAVAAYFNGVKVKSATIVPNPEANTLGQVRHEEMFRGLDPATDVSDRVRLRIERAIIISLAGPLAQKRHRKTSWRINQGEGDSRWIADLALRIGGDGEGASAFLKWPDLQAKRLVDMNWGDIERVAAELLDRRTMTGREIVEVIRGKVESS